jgi:hypothetical protein
MYEESREDVMVSFLYPVSSVAITMPKALLLIRVCLSTDWLK